MTPNSAGEMTAERAHELVSEEAVAAGAKVLAEAPTIDPPYLAPECWHGTVREVLVAALPFLVPPPEAAGARREEIERIIMDAYDKRTISAQGSYTSPFWKEAANAILATFNHRATRDEIIQLIVKQAEHHLPDQFTSMAVKLAELSADAILAPPPHSQASEVVALIKRLREDGTSWAQPLFNEAADMLEALSRQAPQPAAAMPSGEKTLSDYSDAEIANEHHRRAMTFLGDQTVGVSLPAAPTAQGKA